MEDKKIENLNRTLLALTGTSCDQKNDYTYIQSRAKNINKDFLGLKMHKEQQEENEKEIKDALQILSENSLKDLNKTMVLEKMVKELKGKVDDIKSGDNVSSPNLIKEIGIVKAAVENKAKSADEQYAKLHADMQDVVKKYNDVASKTESANRAMEEQGRQFGTQIDFLSKRFTELGTQLQKGNELSEQNYNDLCEQYNALSGVMETLQKKIEDNRALTGSNREEVKNKFSVIEGQYKSLQDIFKGTLDKTLFLEKNVKDFNARVAALAQKQKETDGKSAEAVAAVRTEFKQLGNQFDILKKAVAEKKEKNQELGEALEKSIQESKKSYNLIRKDIENIGNTTSVISVEVQRNTGDIQDVKNRQFLLTDKLNAFIVDTEKKAEEAIAGQNYLKDKHDALNKTVTQYANGFDVLRNQLAAVVSESKKDFLGVQQRQQQTDGQVGQLKDAVDVNAKKIDMLSKTFVEHGDKNKERFSKQATALNAIADDFKKLQTDVYLSKNRYTITQAQQQRKIVALKDAIDTLASEVKAVPTTEEYDMLKKGLEAGERGAKVRFDRFANTVKQQFFVTEPVRTNRTGTLRDKFRNKRRGRFLYLFESMV